MLKAMVMGGMAVGGFSRIANVLVSTLGLLGFSLMLQHGEITKDSALLGIIFVLLLTNELITLMYVRLELLLHHVWLNICLGLVDVIWIVGGAGIMYDLLTRPQPDQTSSTILFIVAAVALLANIPSLLIHISMCIPSWRKTYRELYESTAEPLHLK